VPVRCVGMRLESGGGDAPAATPLPQSIPSFPRSTGEVAWDLGLSSWGHDEAVVGDG
jgi:hypothetical protein